ncbi:MAG: stage II sporulation protein M [Deltaproteobacteria bacterium]|nr:stage II sporulation protein M [Deltaproteobacteria bacterium]
MAYTRVFGWAFWATLLGTAISGLFFRDSLLMASTGLAAILLVKPMDDLLTENRDAIWLHRRSSWEANSVLTFKIISIFLSVFAATIAYQLALPAYFLAPLEPTGPLFSNQPLPLFLHNLRVLLACLLLAFIYRGTGLLLVICWNAISWSVSIFTFIHAAHAAGGARAWFYALAVMPHLILETAAYVTAGMSGVFISKAIFKYRLSSSKFFRVSRACVVILLASVLARARARCCDRRRGEASGSCPRFCRSTSRARGRNPGSRRDVGGCRSG